MYYFGLEKEILTGFRIVSDNFHILKKNREIRGQSKQIQGW